MNEKALLYIMDEMKKKLIELMGAENYSEFFYTKIKLVSSSLYGKTVSSENYHDPHKPDFIYADTDSIHLI